MPIIKKPDYNIFASEAKTGEIVDFPNLLRGWGVTLDQTAGKPPMEWFNALQKRTDEWLTYLSQRGLPEWQNTLDYPKDAVVQFGGKFYVAKRNTKDAQPDRSQNDWAVMLGSAASRDVGTAKGQVMEVGAFGLGAGPQHKADAYSNIAQIYRLNVSSNGTPGGSTYGVISLPGDGAPSAGYLAAGINGELHVGRSTAASNRVTWDRVYTTAYKPTAADINAYTKQEADGRFAFKSITVNGKPLSSNVNLTAGDVNAWNKTEADGRYIYKTGDTIAALNVTKGLYVGEDTTVNRTLYVDGVDFINKRKYFEFNDGSANHRQTSGLHLLGAGDQYADLMFDEVIGQYAALRVHTRSAGNDGWYEFRHDGTFNASGTVGAGGGNGSKMHPDGNIWGAAWGGYLKDFLNNKTSRDEFQSGANGNGAWAKLPGGGMWCRHNLNLNANGVTTWTFPASFPNTPGVYITSFNGEFKCWLNGAGPSNCSIYNAGPALNVNVFAIW